MYRKRDREQMTIDGFATPFGGKLDAGNRWVKTADLIPWDMVEDIYAASFRDENPDGRPPISARVAFGALYIKENENFSDERTMEHIMENNYMQYFLGLTEFRTEPPFDTSMMVWFRKRFSVDDVARINEEMYRRSHPQGGEPSGGGNGGKLILDATCAPSDVRPPTDLSLLNECRENTERMIDGVWGRTERKGHKTSYSRKKARKSYLKVAKQRKARRAQIRKATREQLEYTEKNLDALGEMLSGMGEDALTARQRERLGTIREVARQQRRHLEDPAAPIADRIVSLRQPHVRPIVRGKASAAVEFGQKVAVSVVGGYTFIDAHGWNNFAEGKTLIASAEKYRERHGVYPEAILADKTYRNRENLRFCAERGIRLSGPRLGRPKAAEAEADKERAYLDGCERNEVEGRFGTCKRRYGMGRIMSWLPRSGETEAAMNVLCMNVAKLLKAFLRLLMGLRFYDILRSREAFLTAF